MSSTPYSCTTRICEPGTPVATPRTHTATEDLAPPSPPCRLSYMTSGGVPLTHSAPSAAIAPPLQQAQQRHFWQPCAGGGINMQLLRSKDQPILFFDEVLLYQVSHSLTQSLTHSLSHSVTHSLSVISVG
jgi:hypothetical protein